MHAVGQATHLFVQVVDFLIALVEATLQIQNSNDARKVDALARKLIDKLEAFDVGLRIHARVAARALGAHKALLLVNAQRLRVHARQLGRDADHIERCVPVCHCYLLHA